MMRYSSGVKGVYLAPPQCELCIIILRDDISCCIAADISTPYSIHERLKPFEHTECRSFNLVPLFSCEHGTPLAIDDGLCEIVLQIPEEGTLWMVATYLVHQLPGTDYIAVQVPVFRVEDHSS